MRTLLLSTCFSITMAIASHANTFVEGGGAAEIRDGDWREATGEDALLGAVLFNVSIDDLDTPGFTRTNAISENTQKRLPPFIGNPGDLTPNPSDETSTEGSTGFSGPYPEIVSLEPGLDRVRSGLAGVVRTLDSETEVPPSEVLFAFKLKTGTPPALRVGILTTHAEHSKTVQVSVMEGSTPVTSAESTASGNPMVVHEFNLSGLKAGQTIVVQAKPRWVDARGQSVAYIAGVIFASVD